MSKHSKSGPRRGLASQPTLSAEPRRELVRLSVERQAARLRANGLAQVKSGPGAERSLVLYRQMTEPGSLLKVLGFLYVLAIAACLIFVALTIPVFLPVLAFMGLLCWLFAGISL